LTENAIMGSNNFRQTMSMTNLQQL